MTATKIEFKRKPVAVPDDEANGIALRACRTEAGVTQRELADAIGVHPSYMSDLENANRGLTEDVFNRAMAAIHKLKKHEQL